MVGILAATAAGCGTSSDGASANSGAACVATPGVTPHSIKLGLIYPNTGTSAELFSDYRAGLDARLGVENAKGGVNGRTINYDWADDRTDLRTNLAAAQELVNDKQVFSLMEESSVATGSAQWLNQQGVPVIGSSIELVWSRFHNMFSYSNFVTKGPSITTWGQFLKDHGATKVAILYSGLNETSAVFRDKFVASVQSAGLAMAPPIDMEPGSADYDAVIAEMKADHVDALVGATDPTMFVTLAATAAADHVGLKVSLTSSGYDQKVLDKAGPLLQNSFSVFLAYAPFEERTPGHQEFLKAMAEYSPQLQPQASEIALEGWVAADMFITGLRSAGTCVTRANFMRAMEGMRNYTANGIVPSVDIGANFGKQATCYTFVQVAPGGRSWRLFQPHRQCGQLVATQPTTG